MLNVGTEFRKGILFVRLKGHLNKDTINKLKKSRLINYVYETTDELSAIKILNLR